MNKIETSVGFKNLISKSNDKVSKLIENVLNGEIEPFGDYPMFIDIFDGKISYLPLKRYNKTLCDGEVYDYYNNSLRVISKPGVFLKKLINIDKSDINQMDIEGFSLLVKSHRSSVRFEVVSGEDIIEYYSYRKHSKGSGTLYQSCMKHDFCKPFLKIYSDNPDKVKLLLMLDEYGLVISRSLLWDLDGVKVMDRIYSIDDVNFNTVKDWGFSNGYICKYKQSWNNTSIFTDGFNTLNLKLSFKLEKWDYSILIDDDGNISENSKGGYAYFDTFKWLDMSNGTFYNYDPCNVNVKDKKVLCSTRGDFYAGSYLSKDDLTGLYHYEGEVEYLKYIDKYSYTSNNVISKVNKKQRILSSDASYMDGVGYIFNKENDHFNDHFSISKILHDKEIADRKKLEKGINNSLNEISLTVGYVDRYMEVLDNGDYNTFNLDITPPSDTNINNRIYNGVCGQGTIIETNVILPSDSDNRLFTDGQTDESLSSDDVNTLLGNIFSTNSLYGTYTDYIASDIRVDNNETGDL